jgi:hypothetical protein
MSINVEASTNEWSKHMAACPSSYCLRFKPITDPPKRYENRTDPNNEWTLAVPNTITITTHPHPSRLEINRHAMCMTVQAAEQTMLMSDATLTSQSISHVNAT